MSVPLKIHSGAGAKSAKTQNKRASFGTEYGSNLGDGRSLPRTALTIGFVACRRAGDGASVTGSAVSP